MDSPYRRCLVRAGFSSVPQRLKVSHQVDCIVLAILSVHAHCSVFTGASIGLKEPVDVDVVGQRRECHLRTLSSDFCFPSLFRGHVPGFRCTRHVSLQRLRDMAPPSLHRVPRNGSPDSTVLRDAPTPVRPSRRTSLPSLGDTTLASCLLPASRRRAVGRGVGIPDPEPDLSVETDGSLRFPSSPRVPTPRSWTPVGPITPGHCGVSTRPPLVSTTEAPALNISGLDSMALGLTVYASQGGSPLHHARLVSGCWPSSAGRDSLTRRVATKGFCVRVTSSFLELS